MRGDSYRTIIKPRERRIFPLVQREWLDWYDVYGDLSTYTPGVASILFTLVSRHQNRLQIRIGALPVKDKIVCVALCNV